MSENEMTYSESAKGVYIDANRARQEIESHGADWEEFLVDEFGFVDAWDEINHRFDAHDILVWLGY